MLVAEDSPLSREVIPRPLKRLGADVDCAGNGRQAMEAVRNADPNYDRLVRMDVRLPIMDGMPIIKEIRAFADTFLFAIPIVAMTVDAFFVDRERAPKWAGRMLVQSWTMWKTEKYICTYMGQSQSVQEQPIQPRDFSHSAQDVCYLNWRKKP